VFENRKSIKFFGSKEEEITGREGINSRGFRIFTHIILLTNKLTY
jgi:hypothetical protein